jgi:hypothetical protein
VCSGDGINQTAVAACQILIDTSDVFGTCLEVVSWIVILIKTIFSIFKKVNGQQYYNACVVDYCITATYRPKQLDQALCNSYTAFARECTNNYLDIDWRTSSRCRMY